VGGWLPLQVSLGPRLREGYRRVVRDFRRGRLCWRSFDRGRWRGRSGRRPTDSLDRWLDHQIRWAAYQNEVFDVVAADEDQPPATIDRDGIDDSQTRNPTPANAAKATRRIPAD